MSAEQPLCAELMGWRSMNAWHRPNGAKAGYELRVCIIDCGRAMSAWRRPNSAEGRLGRLALPLAERLEELLAEPLLV